MIGRKNESDILSESTEKSQAQLIVVYGRRRVGKTFLVRETFPDGFFFQHTGILDVPMAGQLAAFRDSLIEAGAKDVPELADWREAFNELKRLVKEGGKGKKVMFIDEMPWMDTPKSRFVQWFEAFWNGWASARKDIVLIVCGSAASWLVKKVFRNRGGLYNRVSEQIHIRPFTLHECREYCRVEGLSLSDIDIAELYMAFGGIPYYWSMLKKGESVAQNLDRLLFSRNGKLRNEFRDVFGSLFGESVAYETIVRALASVKSGMPRDALLSSCGMVKGGNATRYLDDLEACGFIRKFTAFGKRKRDALYQLMDNFTLFHMKFLDGESNPDEHFWQHSANQPSVNVWRGLAFERICLQHVAQIKEAIGVGGVLTHVFAWRHAPDSDCPEGAQIDLLIERADRVVNVCEIKFTQKPYLITREYNERLRRKVAVFASVTKTRLAPHLTMITTYGISRSGYLGAFQSEVTLEDLFVDVRR